MVKQAPTTTLINRFVATLIAAALFLPLFLLTPLATFFVNPALDAASPGLVLAVFGLIGVLLTAGHTVLLIKLPAAKSRIATSITLALAVGIYVQTWILSPYIDFDFTGDIIDWSELGSWPIWELLILASVLVTTLAAGYFLRAHVGLIAGLVLVAASVSAAGEIHRGITTYNTVTEHQPAEVDPGVYEFSSELNIIHLLPDALQSDVAAQILKDKPELAARLEGFVLFEANVGAFRSTAPTLPTLLNGEMYDLERGFVTSEVTEKIHEKSYVNDLQNAGFRTDFAASSPIACLKDADTCTHLPWSGDFHSRGYETAGHAWALDIALVTDLALFRQVPTVFKQPLYNSGEWRLSRLFATAFTDFTRHAPVFDEWRENARVTDARPRYKWYHWIGVHAPHMWDAQCNYIGRQKNNPEIVTAQTECVLRRIADFADHLRTLDIYDESLIVISSDHGTSLPSRDIANYQNTSLLQPHQIGQARPLFMVKPFGRRGPLDFNDTPTHIIDHAPTILGAVELETDRFDGIDILNQPVAENRTRDYHLYAHTPFRWGPEPVAYHQFRVHGDPRDWNNWLPVYLHVDRTPPRHIENILAPHVQPFIHGIGGRWGDAGRMRGRDFTAILRAEEETDHILTVHARLSREGNSRQIHFYANGQHQDNKQQLDGSHREWQILDFCIPAEGVKTMADNLFHLRFEHFDDDTAVLIGEVGLTPERDC